MSIIISTNFQAFKFDGICQTVALSLCPLIGKYDGIEPVCYSRNVDLAGTLIFQPGTLIVHGEFVGQLSLHHNFSLL